MGARPNPDAIPGIRWAWRGGLTAAVAAGLWFLPLWRVVPLSVPVRVEAVAFNPVEFAARFWTETLPPARAKAVNAAMLAAALRRDPNEAVRLHAQAVGLGTPYFFVRGTGRVIAVERNTVILELEGGEGATIALETGAIFGNTVRDGPGLLNLNDFPSLADFNALSAELNRLVEERVLPALRRQAAVGLRIEFAGCAEAEAPVVAGKPLLALVPLFAEVRAAP